MFDFLRKKQEELFTPQIYDWMKQKQIQKYEDIFPKISNYLKPEFNVLDIGIGKAWLEEFFEQKNIKFSKIVGVDVNEKMITPKKIGIQYILSSNFKTKEKFDLVICFDSLHLLKDHEIVSFVKPGGFFLISLPERWKDQLEFFRNYVIIAEGEIGQDEIDYFIFGKPYLSK